MSQVQCKFVYQNRYQILQFKKIKGIITLIYLSKVTCRLPDITRENQASQTTI